MSILHRAIRRVYNKYLWDPWYVKSKTAAAKDPEWAAIEARRDTGRNTILFLSDEHDLTMEHWERQHEIEERLTPRPWWLRWGIMHKIEAFRPINTVQFWHARATRGWAPSDTWNLHGYLAKVISGSVLHLRDNGNGWPGDHLVNEGEWAQILTDIADGFAAVLDLDDHDQPWNSDPSLSKDQGDAMRTAWEAQCMGRFNHGMDLFKTWYFHLWD